MLPGACAATGSEPMMMLARTPITRRATAMVRPPWAGWIPSPQLRSRRTSSTLYQRRHDPILQPDLTRVRISRKSEVLEEAFRMQYPILVGLLWVVWFIGTPSIDRIRQQHSSPPVLSFPERGLDDSVAYQGYQTRFFRDASDNTLQIYLDGRSGRIVHLWADADDESAGLTVRNAA